MCPHAQVPLVTKSSILGLFVWRMTDINYANLACTKFPTPAWSGYLAVAMFRLSVRLRNGLIFFNFSRARANVRRGLAGMINILCALWRKLHLAVDATSVMTLAQALTDQDAGHQARVAPLLGPIDRRIGRVRAHMMAPPPTGRSWHTAVTAVKIPRSTAIASSQVGPATRHDRHLKMIAERGRLAWQAVTDYGQ
jgi:hypothetical protein